ncbi:MAG: ADP-heptose synthase, partial [Crenarchaeota archaeon]|nr:ADP-heptose synthase [Thermoproteota archaeon]
YRIFSLASLECVDAVFSFPETRVTSYLEKIKPNFWAKASDYSLETIEKSEKEVADKLGIEIKILPKLEGYSSTLMIDKIKNS